MYSLLNHVWSEKHCRIELEGQIGLHFFKKKNQFNIILQISGNRGVNLNTLLCINHEKSYIICIYLVTWS